MSQLLEINLFIYIYIGSVSEEPWLLEIDLQVVSRSLSKSEEFYECMCLNFKWEYSTGKRVLLPCSSLVFFLFPLTKYLTFYSFLCYFPMRPTVTQKTKSYVLDVETSTQNVSPIIFSLPVASPHISALFWVPLYLTSEKNNFNIVFMFNLY